MNNADEVFVKALDIMKSELTEISFNTWFKTIHDVQIKDNLLTMNVPNSFNKEMIESRYYDLLKNALLLSCGRSLDVMIYVSGEQHSEPQKTEVQTAAQSGLNPKYTFDTFVVGNGNNFAHAAALAVAEVPGKKYNPLFLYGGVGLGKTHLSHAIGNYILSNNKNAKVKYITMEKFVNDFINSLKDETIDIFKNKYRSVDLLIVDDIQFIINKERIQEEFFHTFNTLYQANKQIVITSDRPPKEIATLEERLRSRFESGLIWDIQPPDVETRIAIIEKKMQNDNIVLPHDIVLFIAENIKSNIRELEGALNRIIALSELSKKTIDLDLAKEAMREFLVENKKKVINSKTVIDEVTRYFSISEGAILSKLKTKELSFYRQIAMYVCRYLTGFSYPKIGEDFSNRDHTTVMYAVEKIETLMKTDAHVKTIVEDLIKNINGD